MSKPKPEPATPPAQAAPLSDDAETAEALAALNPSRPVPQFSCPLHGCTVRVSNVTDAGARCRNGTWYCSQAHMVAAGRA